MSGLNKSMDLRSIKTSNDVLANKGLIICPYKLGHVYSLSDPCHFVHSLRPHDMDLAGCCLKPSLLVCL